MKTYCPGNWGSSPRFSPPADARSSRITTTAIRAGIMQHLTRVGTLNMSAMVMDIRTVFHNGNQAHAEVEFRPKTGAPQGAGMQVAYNLDKRDGAWVVLQNAG